MTRLLTPILICSALSFSLANGQTRSLSRAQRAPRPATITLSELINRFPKYKTRDVKLRVIYHSWFEGSEFTQTADGLKGTGLVWAGFPDTVSSHSSADVSGRLEATNWRPEPDTSGWFYDWQTEMLVTGRMRKSDKKRFGLHGGFKYAFVVSSVEEIGSTKKFDMTTGKYLAVQ